MKVYVLTATDSNQGLVLVELYKDYAKAMDDMFKLAEDHEERIKNEDGSLYGESFVDTPYDEFVHIYDSGSMIDTFYEVVEREL